MKQYCDILNYYTVLSLVIIFWKKNNFPNIRVFNNRRQWSQQKSSVFYLDFNGKFEFYFSNKSDLLSTRTSGVFNYNI